MSTSDFIVVGGGSMGISTALALQRSYPQANVILFEGLETTTASKDINKAIRTPYLDEDISYLAEEAQKKWETTSPYQDYYRRTAWIRIISESNTEGSLKSASERVITSGELMKLVGSDMAPQLDEGDELWINEEVGCVDAAKALEATAAYTASLGVVRRKEQISQILMQNGVCKGVENVNGDTFLASTVVIAAGAWTPALLKDSKIEFPDDFFQPTAVWVGMMDITEAELNAFRSMPVLVTGHGEIMPPSNDEKVLKITTSQTFQISHPEEPEKDVVRSSTPHRTVLRKLMPQLEDRPLKWWRCPELMTPDQHPLIDRAPEVDNLFVAAGGSYHSFKFLPVIGDLVVHRIRGGGTTNTMHDRLIRKWGWEKPFKMVALNENMVPRHRQA